MNTSRRSEESVKIRNCTFERHSSSSSYECNDGICKAGFGLGCPLVSILLFHLSDFC